jgi:hypothetical protein
VEKIEVDMLTPQHNYAVLRMPDRKFPGVVFQGDSLSVLVQDVCELRDGLRLIAAEGDLRAAQDEADLIARHLLDIQSAYEAVLAKHGIRLPYVKPA